MYVQSVSVSGIAFVAPSLAGVVLSLSLRCWSGFVVVISISRLSLWSLRAKAKASFFMSSARLFVLLFLTALDKTLAHISSHANLMRG